MCEITGLFQDALSDIERVASKCQANAYVAPAADYSRKRRDVDDLERRSGASWMDGYNQWENLNQVTWYQANLVLMQIYRREGQWNAGRTCQEMGDRIVSFNTLMWCSL